ncbi:hypothetical protein HYW58_02715 [Candidatus Kaiserbacteria bacterium]|nr:hypothetical protein [Candidatus Kaiserbacteria bacterium]
MENSILEQKIMARVGRIHSLKRVLNPLMLKVYAFVAVSAGMLSLVSIKNVFLNMPPLFELQGVYYFVIAALRNTELSVQIISLALFILVLLLVRDTVRNLTFHAPYVPRAMRRVSH